MKYLLVILICILVPARAEELLVTPKSTYMDEGFDAPTVNNRIRPPKNMHWQVIGTEYVGTPKEQSSTKAQSLMAFWTPNPHNGLLLEFDFKFDQKPDFFEFHLGRNYAKIYFKNDSLRFRRDELINGKIKSLDHVIAKQLATNQWNKIRIESHHNQYLIRLNKITPLFVKSNGENPEVYGGFKVTGLGVKKFYLDNILLQNVKGPTAGIENKISSYIRLGSSQTKEKKSSLTQAKSSSEKEAGETQKKPEQKPLKPIKADKFIYI